MTKTIRIDVKLTVDEHKKLKLIAKDQERTLRALVRLFTINGIATMEAARKPVKLRKP